MANHKRGRPKSSRAGCLLCKPWKANGAKQVTPPTAFRVLQGTESDIAEGIVEWDEMGLWTCSYDPYDEERREIEQLWNEWRGVSQSEAI